MTPWLAYRRLASCKNVASPSRLYVVSFTATAPGRITVRTRSSGAAVIGAALATSGTLTANSLSSQSYNRVAAMKNTSRQRMTSTMGVMLMYGTSSFCCWLESIVDHPLVFDPAPGAEISESGSDRGRALGQAVTSLARRQFRSLSIDPRLLSQRIRRRRRPVPPVQAPGTDGLARDQLDNLARVIIEFPDQHIDAIEQVVIGGDREDRDRQPARRGHERQADSLGQSLTASRSHPPAERVERLDDAYYGTEQTQQGTERSHAVEHAQVSLQLDHFARRIEAQVLANRRPGLTPGLDHEGKDTGCRALIGLAQLERPIAIELAGREPLQESVDKLPGDDSRAPYRQQTLEGHTDGEDRAGRQRPEHGVGPGQELKHGSPVHSRPRGSTASRGGRRQVRSLLGRGRNRRRRGVFRSRGGPGRGLCQRGRRLRKRADRCAEEQQQTRRESQSGHETVPKVAPRTPLLDRGSIPVRAR